MRKMLLTTLAIASLAAGGMVAQQGANLNGVQRGGIVTANNLGSQYNQGSTQQSQTASASRGDVQGRKLANNVYPAYNHETA
jgi:hypothetical protein